MTDCIFCHHITDSQILYQTDHFILVFDIDPIQTGHMLLISKEHYSSLTELPQPLLHELIETQAYLVRLLEDTLRIDGVTIASNDNQLMDSGTHFHVHLIPRNKDDGFWELVDIEPLQLPLDQFLKNLQENK